MRLASGKITTIAAALALFLALAPPAQARKPRHSKHAKGTLVVNTYVAGAGEMGAPEPPPEPYRSASIRVLSNGELIREVVPTSSHTVIELKPGHYLVRAVCGGAKAVVRAERTTTVGVPCFRE